ADPAAKQEEFGEELLAHLIPLGSQTFIERRITHGPRRMRQRMKAIRLRNSRPNSDDDTVKNQLAEELSGAAVTRSSRSISASTSRRNDASPCQRIVT